MKPYGRIGTNPSRLTKTNDMKHLNDQEKLRYSKLMDLPGWGEEGQLKIKNSRILVIGAGGLGSAVLPILAAAGVGTVGIVENDNVETSNLQRQILYNPEDAGQSKMDLVVSMLKKKNPDAEIITHRTRFDESNAEELAGRYDIVADCTDNFKTRFLINDTCAVLKKPLVYASISDYEGQVIILHNKEEKNLRDLFPEVPEDNEIKGILPTLPNIIGAIQANETLKVIAGNGSLLDGQLLIFNVYTNNFQIVRL
jgi:adenylyltransferase/sulfurtransferase